MNNGITFEEQELMALYNASGTRQGLIDALEEMHPYLGPVFLMTSRSSFLESLPDMRLPL